MTIVAFRDRPFGERFASMGDRAELVCEEVFGLVGRPFQRFGLLRPPFPMGKLGPFVRYTPDYITSDALVECQGLGKDGVVKVKRDKLQALQSWDLYHRVELFLWWSAKKKWMLIALDDVAHMCDDPEMSSIGFFDGDKAYWALKAEAMETETRTWNTIHQAKIGDV